MRPRNWVVGVAVGTPVGRVPVRVVAALCLLRCPELLRKQLTENSGALTTTYRSKILLNNCPSCWNTSETPSHWQSLLKCEPNCGTNDKDCGWHCYLTWSQVQFLRQPIFQFFFFVQLAILFFRCWRTHLKINGRVQTQRLRGEKGFNWKLRPKLLKACCL